MEFIGIDLSLTAWSYIIFVINIIFYTSTLIASFGIAGKANLISMLISYLLLQVVMIAYSIDTKQPGFLLSVIFQTLLLIVMLSIHRKFIDEDN